MRPADMDLDFWTAGSSHIHPNGGMDVKDQCMWANTTAAAAAAGRQAGKVVEVSPTEAVSMARPAHAGFFFVRDG